MCALLKQKSMVKLIPELLKSNCVVAVIEGDVGAGDIGMLTQRLLKGFCATLQSDAISCKSQKLYITIMTNTK